MKIRKIVYRLSGYRLTLMKIVMCQLLMFLLDSKINFAQEMINTWQGFSSEDVTYRYILDINFQGTEDARLNLYIPPNIDTPTFSQKLKSHTINYSVEPFKTTPVKDSNGNQYIDVEWPNSIDSACVTLETNVEVRTAYGCFYSTTPYPIESRLIPDSIQIYLQSTGFCQSDSPEIRSLADSLVSKSSSEVDAIVKIINWVRYNMKWICAIDMPTVHIDALHTLYTGGGNCVNFSNLSIALLRAAGIPAREVIGPMIHDWKSAAAHRWAEAYFPDKGWIQYETSYWMPNEGSVPWTFLIPRHITTFSGPEIGLTTGYANEEHYTTTVIKSSPSPLQASSISVDNNNFITYCVTIRNHPNNSGDTVLLQTSTSSTEWAVSLSQDSIYFDPNGPWGETRDVSMTITPPQNVTSVDTASITVTATSQISELAEQLVININTNLSVTDHRYKPAGFKLYQNYPNPFNPSTMIKYRLTKSSLVLLNIYNLAGQEIEILVNGFQSSGEHEITWLPKDLASGIYFYKLHAGEFSEIRKLILQK